MKGGCLKIVMQHFRQHVRIPGPQRLQHVGIHLRLGCGREDVLCVPVAVPIEFAIDKRCAHAEVGEREHPLEAALGERGTQLVAAPGADRRATGEGKRHIGAELGRELEQVFATEVGAPEAVTGEKGGRGIRRSASHSPRNRHVLLDLEMHALAVAGAVREHGRRLDGEVAAIGRQGRRVDGSGECHGEVVGGGCPDVLIQRDRLERGGHVVETVLEQGADLEEHVDLARCPCVHHLRSGRGGH